MINQPAVPVPGERDASLIGRIGTTLRRLLPAVSPPVVPPGQSPPPPDDTTSTGTLAWALNRVADLFRSQMDRYAIYADADEMDETSEEVSVALDVIADDTVSSEDGETESFVIQCEDERVRQILDQVNEATGLHREAYGFVRNLVKYGDAFAEIVVSADYEIIELRQLPPATMHRNEDQFGKLVLGQPDYDDEGRCLSKPGQCAFEQRQPDSEQLVAAFEPWQIVHSRLNWDGFNKYGRSHLRVARIIWRKLKAIDESMVIARLSRAYPKYRHKIDTTGLSPTEAQAAIKKYVAGVNQQTTVGTSRDKQYSVTSDLFLGAPKVRGDDGKLYENASDIEVLEAKGDTIVNIDDVKDYLHRKFLTTLRVPPALMGWEEQINAKATLTGQDVEYARFRRTLQQLVGHSFRQVFDIALVLQGIDPESAEYEIVWPSINTSDEESGAVSYFNEAQADKIYLDEGAIDAEWVMRNRFQMSEEEIEEKQAANAEREAQQAAQAAALAKAQAAQGPPQGAAEAEPAAANGRAHPIEQELALELAELRGRVAANGNGNGHAPAPPPEVRIQIGDGSLSKMVAERLADEAQVIQAVSTKALEVTGAKIIDRGLSQMREVGREIEEGVRATADMAHVAALEDITKQSQEHNDRMAIEGRRVHSALTTEAQAATQHIEAAQRNAERAAERAEKAAGKIRQQAKDAIWQEVQNLVESGVLNPAPQSDDASVTVQYDRDNRVIGATTADGRFIKVEYDAKGRVIGAAQAIQENPKG